MAKIPIWLDCDTGHDDAYAILLAAHHPSARLIGVSTTHGNAPIHHTTRNTRAVLHAIGRPQTLLIRGTDRPLTRAASFAPAIHGESGLDGVDLLPKLGPSPDEADGVQSEALEARIDQIAAAILAEEAGKPWLVATGPLTNVAILLRRHPQLASHVAGVSIMGGAVGGGFTDAPMGAASNDRKAWFGNSSPVAEFNIFADPEAAQEVFSNAKLNAGSGKLVMLGLDITHLCRGVSSVQSRLLKSDYPVLKLREMMHQAMVFFAGTYSTHLGILDGPPLHDPLAVWAALEPERFKDARGLHFNLSVTVQGKGYDKITDPDNCTGQTVAVEQADGGVRIPTGLDLDAFWTRIDECLTAAEEQLVANNSNPWA